MSGANRESFQESFDKLSPAEKARYILLEQCSTILYHPATSHIVHSEDTGRLAVFEDLDGELAFWPRVDVDFGGHKNYRVVVSERLGPVHTNAGWTILRVYETE